MKIQITLNPENLGSTQKGYQDKEPIKKKKRDIKDYKFHKRKQIQISKRKSSKLYSSKYNKPAKQKPETIPDK